MSEKKPAKLTDAERIARLEQLVREQAIQITKMQLMGGFSDSKTVGIRCTRIEERLALAELDTEMLKDVAAHACEMMRDHLVDRHGEDEMSTAIDMAAWRQIRRRLREWAQKRGLMVRQKKTETRAVERCAFLDRSSARLAT